MKFDRVLLPVLLLIPSPTIAQVTPMGSTVVTPSGMTQTITGGASSVDGKNLFHRFDQFNVMTGQRVLFDPGAGVRNILTRISQTSLIDGVLQVNGGANLYLLSPSGLLFGPNARLNLNGNFFGTTATGVGFSGGVWTGENDARSLVGDPSSFVFALSQPSAVINAGVLQNPGTIALVGGQVANTGTLNSAQVAIVAVPGSQRVQIGDPNGVLKFEFQPLPGQTVGETLQNWTPNRLSDLIAKGNALNHGTRLETLPDGSVRVVGSGVTIGDGPGAVVVDGTIGATTGMVMGDGVTVGGVNFETNAGTNTLLIDAAKSLFLGGANGGMNFGQGEAVTLRAGESIVSSVALLSRERDLVLQSPVIRTQLMDTSIAGNGVGGAIRLEGLKGDLANVVGFSNLVTPRRDVGVRGDRVTGQFVITNATTGVNSGLQAGKVTIESRYFTGIGGAITDGMTVNITNDITQANGTAQSGLIITNGGDINISGSRVNAGMLWSSVRDNNRTDGNAGNITVNAVNKLSASRVEAIANGMGRAGDIKITSEEGDVVVDSVQAYGGAKGGTIALNGDRVRITGSALGPVVAGQPYTFSSVHAGERIAITHRGGNLNQDFVVGNSGVNGSNDKLRVGDAVLDGGSFAIKGKTYTDRPIAGLSITSVNSTPTFPGNLSGFPVVVTPGLASRFTLGGIGFPSPVDGESDRVKLYIRPRPGSSVGGQLALESGVVVTGLTAVKLTDRLVYRPTSQIGNTVLDRFEVIALDVVPTAGSIAEAKVLPLVFTTPVIPVVEAIAAPEPVRQAQLPEDSGMSNVSLSEVAALDKELSKDFEGMGEGDGGSIAASMDGTLTREIEQKTGVRPAIVYLRTLRRSDQGEGTDALEFTILTSRGRFRRRVPIDAAMLDAEVAKFRREVTNPIRTHTTSYLPMAQKLYGWLIAPMLSDLKAQGITNLVFIPEGGLRSLPYAALHDGKQFLIENYSVGLMPSLGLVKTGYRNLRNSSLLSVGISRSTQGQSALPMVVPELETVGKLWGSGESFLNDRATLDSLQSKQGRGFQILHLATHANFVAGKPREAYIQLWNDRLRLDQLRSLDWNKPPIDLMVLSACKTAVGDRDSELGFAGLALQSGVKTTIASLWSVNDTATMGLISQFYDRLLRSPVKAEALRLAQVAMLRGEVRLVDGELVGFGSGLRVRLPEGSLGGETSFRHPFYWAAFTVVGNPW